MKLEENEHIIENKELKTNSQKKRFIYLNNSDESYFTNGTVTLIHQEQFNQFKKEYEELKQNVQNPINEEDIKELENQIQLLQEEKKQLEETIISLEEENKNLTLELKVASKSDMLERLELKNNERITDLKELISKKEEEVISYKSKVTDLEEENKKLVETKQSELDSLKEENQNQINLLQKENEEEGRKLTSEITSLKVALGIVLSKYENVIDEYNLLKNRSFFSRLMNNNKKEIAIEDISEYKKLLESKKTYKPKLIETELE